MINFFKKMFSKQYIPCMEVHNRYGCYLSLKVPSNDFDEGIKLFFDENNFIIAYNMFDPEWDRKTILEQIFIKILKIYNFDPNDKDIDLVIGKNKIYLPNGYYVLIPEDGIFIFNNKKINIFY